MTSRLIDQKHVTNSARLSLKTTLFKKYALITSTLIGLSLLLSGVLSISYAYRENQQALVNLQREKAEAAAARIGQYLFDIEKRVGVTNVTQHDGAALDKRMAEIQLLRRTVAINEIALIDLQGREILRVARQSADVIRSGRDFSDVDYFQRAKSGRHYRSPVYFRDGGLFMKIAMAVGSDAAGITVVEIDLEFLLAGISQIKAGMNGHAYAVDSQGRLIAHPDIGLVLRNTHLTDLPQIKATLATLQPSSKESPELIHAHSLKGEDVLTAYAAIPQLGWFVFVEEPLSEAYRPLYAQVARSALLVLIGMLLALVASVTMVRQMTRPIRALQDGAALIGKGALDHRLSVTTGDELEELADSFNRMAEQLQESYATLEKKVEERTSELAESNHKLELLSATDALTGIANRRRFDEVLALEWSRATRTGQPLALAMLDIDWFKAYNDHYGHQAGDACLQRVARVISDTICRGADLVARYGGEEFVFIAPATNAETALSLAEKLCEEFRIIAIPHEHAPNGCVTVSIGVASMIPDVELNSSILIHAADQAMYRAKELGRNMVVLA
jgi:diguanylate cyclase (GGDEF)-like protein